MVRPYVQRDTVRSLYDYNVPWPRIYSVSDAMNSEDQQKTCRKW
jgi:hypothetical protein